MVKFARGFKARANDIALGLRIQAGLSKVAPLDPRDVFQRLSVRIVPLSEFRSACPSETEALLSHSGGSRPCCSPLGKVNASSFTMILTVRDGRSATWPMNWLTFFWPIPVRLSAWETWPGGPTPWLRRKLLTWVVAFLSRMRPAHRIAFSGVDPCIAADSYGVSEDMVTYRLRISGALKRVRRFS